MATTQGDAVLDEGRIAISADAVGMLNGFIGLARHAGSQVITQLRVTDDSVLEKVVVLDVRMVVGHHALQIPMAPTQVVAQHQIAGGVGLLGLIVWSDVGHRGALRRVDLGDCRILPGASMANWHF